MRHFIKPAQSAVLTLAVVALSLVVTAQAYAVDIKTVVSDKGIKALLVEDYTVPLIAVSFSFKGGTSQDAAGKEGTAKLLTNMLDEGAGDIKSQAFQETLDDNGMNYSFSASLDAFSGGIKTLKENAPRSFELLKLMLNAPRFDAEPLERMKAGRYNGLRSEKTNPQSIAGKAWRQALFGEHPYGRPANGTLDSMKAITSDDLNAYRKSVFARDKLVIGVVGAISEAELKAMLDDVFGGLPAKANLKPIPEIEPQIGEKIHIEFATPQTNIRIGLPGMRREDPDFYGAYLMNYILGGGSFSSRLYEEVREKRGLAYGVYSYLGAYDHTGFFGIGTATRTERVDEAVKVIRAEIERMAKDGPTAEELQKAKDFNIGTYAISNLDTSDKIAGVLVGIQRSDLGIDYIDKRKEYFNSVTVEDAKRIAAKLLKAEPTIITVGQKKG